MSEKEFLEKYGKESVFFNRLDSYRVHYHNEELGIWCEGNIDYRDSLKAKESVNSISNLHDFKFGILDTKIILSELDNTKYGIKKGYTIHVHSWENDWDSHQDNHITVNTIEEAKVWYGMMQLCKDNNDKPESVIKLGNSISFDDKQNEMILNFMKEHYHILKLYYNKAYKRGLDNLTDDTLFDMFGDLSGELLGVSETYCCRVMEECVVTYSEIDIFPEIVTFDTI